MARSPLTTRQQNDSREKIARRVGQYLDILDKNIRGVLRDGRGNPCELTPGKLKSIELLLQRTVPTVQSVQVQEMGKVPVSEEALVEQLAKLLDEHPAVREKLGNRLLPALEGRAVRVGE